MRTSRFITFALTLLAAVGAYAQATDIHWNLATEPTRTQSVRPGEVFTVIVENAILGEYTLNIDRSRIPISPLDPALFAPPAPPVAGAPAAAPPTPCDIVKDTLKAAVATAPTEQDVALAVMAARVSPNCTPQEIEPVIASLTQSTLLSKQHLDAGEQLVVTLARGTGNAAKTFTLTLTTGAAIEWLTSYGFNYVPRNDETYFLRPRTTDDKFDIIPESDTDDYDFVPSVLFSLYSTTPHTFLEMRFGGSIGFGFDQTTPVAFLGPSINFGRNVTLAAGLVMRPEKRLNPRLDVNTPVAENLGDDELHRSGYRPNWFFGIGVNFSSSPFARNDDEEDEP